MEAKNIFDGVFDRMIEEEAWQNLSSSYPFSAELLEKYKDRLDWHKVSGNGRISGLSRCWKSSETGGSSRNHRRKAFLPQRFS